MLTVTKTFEFAASHRLFRTDWDDVRNAAVFGKCSGVHGHNYKLEVSVAGPRDPETGMVFDAAVLHDLVQHHVCSEVDHKSLDRDVPWLEGEVTTVESLAAAFWRRLAPAVSQASPGARLRRIRLWETSRIYAEIEE